MNLLDILSTSPHYFCRKSIGAKNESSNFDLKVLRVKAPPTRIRVNKYAGSKMSRFEWTRLDLPSALNETLKGTIVLL